MYIGVVLVLFMYMLPQINVILCVVFYAKLIFI